MENNNHQNTVSPADFSNSIELAPQEGIDYQIYAGTPYREDDKSITMKVNGKKWKPGSDLGFPDITDNTITLGVR